MGFSKTLNERTFEGMYREPDNVTNIYQIGVSQPDL
jgi:hypothetical protein